MAVLLWFERGSPSDENEDGLSRQCFASHGLVSIMFKKPTLVSPTPGEDHAWPPPASVLSSILTTCPVRWAPTLPISAHRTVGWHPTTRPRPRTRPPASV